ncbi:voltage-gated potassium channel [Cnuella takakiae]|uniref:Voltage-gated potassium channel n=1 Tax=Cnuella takakiae TaxID=1302690 RepID=A0A1M5AXX8_9BACT|nr:ion transporter [Cnuella takakiae]OLY93264.1 ion transporter [Cnuella takakiae]SHF35069.1 voltage-gated potassium channel [Cnuella takakiae]
MPLPTRERLHQIVFGADTRAGRIFDIILLWLIVASVFVVVLESMPTLNQPYRVLFFNLELFLTALFTFEYLLRIFVSPKPTAYMRSYLGIIDLLGILPFYLSFFFEGYHYFVVFRLLRMLRVFRILRLFRFIQESEHLFRALRASTYKIAVFISFVLTLVVLLGTLMYVVEGPENGFTSIPQSIYWTIVTITTVGYGDITPKTGTGKWIASIIMLCGYAIIAVPTGIVTVALSRTNKNEGDRKCQRCGQASPGNARYCMHCGELLETNNP